ncbi:MAG: hypothetical protein QXY96_06760 [Candidatus Methanomethylicaceae archaeon]
MKKASVQYCNLICNYNLKCYKLKNILDRIVESDMNLENSYMVHILDEAYDRLKNEYLSTSVLGPVRIYAAKNDIDKEFWTFLCFN